MKKYEYMVIYSFKNNFTQGTGRVCIVLGNSIQSYSEIEELDKTIRKHHGMESAFVIDYKLLREYEEK